MDDGESTTKAVSRAIVSGVHPGQTPRVLTGLGMLPTMYRSKLIEFGKGPKRYRFNFKGSSKPIFHLVTPLFFSCSVRGSGLGHDKA